MDEATQREIDKLAWRTLRDAGIGDPPVDSAVILKHLKLHREYYDLQDPSFLDTAKYKILVHGRRLFEIVKKISLKAVLFYANNRVVVDCSLPVVKKEWASLHEAGHRILPWHGPSFYGDTAQTLDPQWHERLEAEANYAASTLMFCGPVFTRMACESKPEWATIEGLREHFGKKSFLATARRYVEHGPDVPMALLVSTPRWLEPPSDQVTRCRHFIRSKTFCTQFGCVSAATLMQRVNANARRQRGGIVADFTLGLRDAIGTLHEFRAETFFNTHYFQTLVVHQGRMDGSMN